VAILHALPFTWRLSARTSRRQADQSLSLLLGHLRQVYRRPHPLPPSRCHHSTFGLRSLHNYETIRCTSIICLSFFVEHDGVLCGCAPSVRVGLTMGKNCLNRDNRKLSVTVFHFGLPAAVGHRHIGRAHNHKSTSRPCQSTPPTSMGDRSQSHNKDLLPHLLAHPRVHHLRSLWHAVDRGSGGSPATRTRFRRRICASGTYRGGHILFRICSAFEQAAFFTQWLPQRQVVRPDLPPRKAMEASARDGLWSVRRRHVSARFPRSLCSPSPFVFPSRRPFSMKNLNLNSFFFFLFVFFFFSPYNQSTPISSAQPQMRFRARPSR
jgi:hypothetical protein